jgi:hypothetical protein
MDESISTDLVGPLRHENGRPIVSHRALHRLRAVAEAVFSTEHGAPPAERIDWLMAELEDFLARAGGRTRLVLKLAALAVNVLAPLVAGHLPPLGRLPLRERARALTLLERGRFGAPVLAIKALLCVLYYEHPDAAREVGFDGDCSGAPAA